MFVRSYGRRRYHRQPEILTDNCGGRCFGLPLRVQGETAPGLAHGASFAEEHSDVTRRSLRQKRTMYFEAGLVEHRTESGATKQRLPKTLRVSLKEPITSQQSRVVSHPKANRGTAILRNRDTFFHTSKHHAVPWREQGWAMEHVGSTCRFRRPPCDSQRSVTAMSVHINNQCASERGICVNLFLILPSIIVFEHVNLYAATSERAPSSNLRSDTVKSRGLHDIHLHGALGGKLDSWTWHDA